MGKTLNIIDKLLSFNTFSRWGKSNRGIKALVIHWVQNTNTSATFNRNYFEKTTLGDLEVLASLRTSLENSEKGKKTKKSEETTEE